MNMEVGKNKMEHCSDNGYIAGYVQNRFIVIDENTLGEVYQKTTEENLKLFNQEQEQEKIQLADAFITDCMYFDNDTYKKWNALYTKIKTDFDNINLLLSIKVTEIIKIFDLELLNIDDREEYEGSLIIFGHYDEKYFTIDIEDDKYILMSEDTECTDYELKAIFEYLLKQLKKEKVNATKKQQENISNLLQLIEWNPELKILPLVASECVQDDTHAWWMAEWGSAEIDEYYTTDERCYLKSIDFEELVDELIDKSEGVIKNDLSDKEAEKLINALPWVKAITVNISGL